MSAPSTPKTGAEVLADELEEDLRAAEERCDDTHAGMANAYGYLSAAVTAAIRRIRKRQNAPSGRVVHRG